MSSVKWHPYCLGLNVLTYITAWIMYYIIYLLRRVIIRPHFNPLRAKFFRGNLNIYLHFMSLLQINMTQVLKIISQVRPGPTYSTKSISWLLMFWRRKEPGHQQPWYWPSYTEITPRTLRVNFNDSLTKPQLKLAYGWINKTNVFTYPYSYPNAGIADICWWKRPRISDRDHNSF